MRASILIASTIAFVSLGVSAVQASDCNLPSDKAVAEIQATGDQDAIYALANLRTFAVLDTYGNELCRIRTSADFTALAGHFAVEPATHVSGKQQDDVTYDGHGGYMRLNGMYPVVYLVADRDNFDSLLAANQKSIDAVWPGRVRAQFRAKLRKYDFAGVHVGDSLQSVLDTLKKANYKEIGSGDQSYGGLTYSEGCSDDWTVLHDEPWTNTHYNLMMCTAGVTALEKLDKDGTLYHIELDFTPVPKIDRRYPLAHAFVWRMEAQVKLKAELEQDYYEKLADQRYGTERHGRLDDYVPPSFRFFTDTENNPQGATRFDITPEERDLKVSVEDRDLLNEKYDATAEAVLAGAKSKTATVPNPHF